MRRMDGFGSPCLFPNSAPTNHLNVIEIMIRTTIEPSQLNQGNFALHRSGCYYLGGFKFAGEEVSPKTGRTSHYLAYITH